MTGLRHWRRPNDYYGPARLDTVGNEELIYVASNREKSLRKVGMGGPSRVAYWENRDQDDDPWRVDQYVSLGADRDAARSVEEFVKHTVCSKATIREVHMAREGRTEAWPYAWGDLLLENLQAGERLELILSEDLRKIVSQRGVIYATRLVMGRAETSPEPQGGFECRCGALFLHLHEGDRIHFSGFTPQQHVARKHDCLASGLRYTGQLTRKTVVTVKGPDFRAGRPTAERVLTLEQFNTARTRVLKP